MEPEVKDNKIDEAALHAKVLQSLLDEVARVRVELGRLNENPLLKMRYSVSRILILQFFKGVFLGLGSFLGATIVVSILVYLLSNIEFIPFIGDVVSKILVEIKK